jgi:hypothetical protein
MLMVTKSMMGIMPELDVAIMLASMMGMPGNTAMGWLAHFMIGTIGYGVVFAALYSVIPGPSPIVRGIVLGLIGWLVMMIVIMPMAGKGLFAMQLGMMAPMMTAVLHIVFGAVLGWTSAKLAGPQFQLLAA